jgi:hypothetical protein
VIRPAFGSVDLRDDHSAAITDNRYPIGIGYAPRQPLVDSAEPCRIARTATMPLPRVSRFSSTTYRVLDLLQTQPVVASRPASPPPRRSLKLPNDADIAQANVFHSTMTGVRTAFPTIGAGGNSPAPIEVDG